MNEKKKTEIYLRIERVLIPSFEFNSKNGCLIEYSILVTSRIKMNMQLIIIANSCKLIESIQKKIL